MDTVHWSDGAPLCIVERKFSLAPSSCSMPIGSLIVQRGTHMPIFVESALERRDERLYRTYALIKDHLQTHIQTRWCSRWPEGNDHGPTHIDRVLDNLGSLLGSDFETRMHPEVETFELFLD